MVFEPSKLKGRPAGAPVVGAPRIAAHPPTAAPGQHVQSNPGVRRISLKLSDQQHGGILDDVDARLVSLKFVIWDYDGKTDPMPFLCVEIKAADGQEATQYYSAGKLERVIPADDGNSLIPAEGSAAKGLNDSTNAGGFLRSLVEHGFPEDKFEEVNGDVNVADGTDVHLIQVAQPKRPGLKGREAGDREPTILLVSKVIRLPWETEGKATGGQPARSGAAPIRAASPAANPRSSVDGLNEKAVTVVMGLLEKEPELPLKGLAQKVYRAVPLKDMDRAALLNLIPTPAFLEQAGVPWAFDGETITGQ